MVLVSGGLLAVLKFEVNCIGLSEVVRMIALWWSVKS